MVYISIVRSIHSGEEAAVRTSEVVRLIDRNVLRVPGGGGSVVWHTVVLALGRGGGNSRCMKKGDQREQHVRCSS